MRNQTKIDAEVTQLLSIKPKVLRRSAFGDDHHNAIDAQVYVLKNNLETDDVYEMGYADNVQDAAIEAVDWLNEEGELDSLAESWKELIR